jgi:DNA-binding IclR family transcriptional regulator
MTAKPLDRESDLDERARAQNSVQVIARVADILRALEGEREGLSLAQIAARVGLARSTVHRLTVGLANEGFVIPASPNGRVRLGPTLARLGAASRRELRDELKPFLRRLAADVEETVDVAMLDGSQVRFVDQIPGAHRLQAVSSVGAAFPLHCSANGKALLAALPREQAERLLPKKLEALTPNTITSRAALWKELDAVAQARVAFDREEHTLGISAVGTAVRDASSVVAAITVVAPTQRFDGNEQYFADHLLRTAQEISASLGALAG